MTDSLHKLARNYSSVVEKILQAFSDIGDVLPRLDRLKMTFPEDTNFNQVVALIYSDIIEFLQRAYKFSVARPGTSGLLLTGDFSSTVSS